MIARGFSFAGWISAATLGVALFISREQLTSARASLHAAQARIDLQNQMVASLEATALHRLAAARDAIAKARREKGQWHALADRLHTAAVPPAPSATSSDDAQTCRPSQAAGDAWGLL